MKLKDLRERKKMTIEEVGNVIGLSGSSYGAYESGKRALTIKYAEKLSELFEVNVLDLMGIENVSGKWTVISRHGTPDKNGDYYVSIRGIRFRCEYMHDITVVTEEGEAVYPCCDTSFCEDDCQHREEAYETFNYTTICRYEDGHFDTECLNSHQCIRDARKYEIIAWMKEPKPCLE